MTIALAFEDGPSLAGGLLGGMMAATMFLTATLDSCLPCYAFDVLLRERKMPSRVDSDAPTMVR